MVSVGALEISMAFREQRPPLLLGPAASKSTQAWDGGRPSFLPPGESLQENVSKAAVKPRDGE